MGAVCALVGALGGAFVAVASIGIGYDAFAVAAPLAGLVCGSGVWWLVVVRTGRHTRWRGASAGALSAVSAHYLCWYLVLLSAFVAQALSKTPTVHGTEVPGPIACFGWAIVPALWSLLLLGWATVPAGTFLGALLAPRQRRAIAAHGMGVNPALP